MVIKKMSNANNNKAWKRDDGPVKKKRRMMIGNTKDVGGRTMIISSAVANKPSSTPPPSSPLPCASAVADNDNSHLDEMKKGSYVIVRSHDNLLYKARVQKIIIHDTFKTRIRVQYVGRKTTTLISRDMIYSVCDKNCSRQLRSGQHHDPIDVAIKREAYNAAKQSSPKKNSTSTIIDPYPLKPVYQVCTHVHAAFWPPNDTDREGEPSWYPGIISSSHNIDNIEKKSIGESSSNERSVRLYNIDFDDGDSITNVPEQYVFLTEEYLVCAQGGRRKKYGSSSWLGDIINIMDDNSSDDWARYVGWYMATIDGVQRTFTLLIDALRAYDSSVIRSKGWKKIKMADLNLPDEWIKLLSKKQDEEEEGDKEVQEKSGKAVGTQTRELTTTKKGRTSTRNCLPVDYYNTLPAGPRGDSIEYYHSSSTVNNNQLKSAKNHSIVNSANESDNDDDFSVDMVDGIEIRSKSNGREARNKSISDYCELSITESIDSDDVTTASDLLPVKKCFKCKVGNCQKWTNVKVGFCESHAGLAKTFNTKTICGKDKFDGAGTEESFGFDCYDVGMRDAEKMTTTCEETQQKNLLPTIRGIHSSREELQSSGKPTIAAQVNVFSAACQRKVWGDVVDLTLSVDDDNDDDDDDDEKNKEIKVSPRPTALEQPTQHVTHSRGSGSNLSETMKKQFSGTSIVIPKTLVGIEGMNKVVIEKQKPTASSTRQPPPAESDKPTIAAQVNVAVPALSIPLWNSKEYMMVWTCDVCHVAQLPTFEEAAEHEKICTGLPPSSPLPIQLPIICEEQSKAMVPIARSPALDTPIVGIESTKQIQVLPKKKQSVKTFIMDHTYNDYSHIEMETDAVGVLTKSSSNYPAKLHDLTRQTQCLINQGRRLPNLADESDLYAISQKHPLPASVDVVPVPENKEESLLLQAQASEDIEVENQKPADTEVELHTVGIGNKCPQGHHNHHQNPAIEVAPPPPPPPPPLDCDMACPIAIHSLLPIPNCALPPVQGAPHVAAPVVPANIAAENAVDQLYDNCPKLLLQRKQSTKIFQVWHEDRKKNWSTNYIKVWTCDVCHVVHLPTFEEAVEHEKMCTGLPPPPSTLPQIKAAHLEREKSEKESSISSVTTSEPTYQSLGGVNLYDTSYPLPQPQQLLSMALNAPVAAANKVAQDTKGVDVIEQEVQVAAMTTSKPRQVTATDINRFREIYKFGYTQHASEPVQH